MSQRAPIVVLFLLLIAVLPLHAQMTLPADSTIEIHPYNDHLVRYFYTPGFTFNVIALYGEEGIFVVDTGFPLTAQQTRAAVLSKMDAPIKYVAISHTHVDHTGGLPAFPEATVIASSKGMTSSYYSLPDRPTFTQPTIEVEDSKTMSFAGETIEFVCLPMGHFKDEMTIRFVESNVVYIGSRVMPGTWPYVDPNFGDVDEVIARPKMLAEEYPEATFAVAHGPDLTADQMIEYHNLLASSAAAIDEKLEAGITPADITADTLFLDQWSELNSGSIPVGAWVNAIARDRGKLGAMPQMVSVSKPMSEVITEKGIDQLEPAYKKLKVDMADKYDFGEAQLNQLGYELVYRNRFDEALKVLKFNATLFDSSANVWDSIGECYLLMGDTTHAIQNYETALTRNPEYQNAIQVLKALK
ncbi:MBL fold metallo-hydrolase [bacterium]|nr:MBL fold metallo-hydrolase [bacterium]